MTGASLSLVSIHRFKSSLTISRCLQSLCFFISLYVRKEKKYQKPPTRTLLSPLSHLLEESNSWVFGILKQMVFLCLYLSLFVFLLSFHSSFLSFGCIGFMKPKCQVFLFSWNLLLRRRGFNAESSKPPSSSVRAVLNEKRAVLGSL